MKQKHNLILIVTGIIILSIVIWIVILVTFFKNSTITGSIFNRNPHTAFQYNMDSLRLIDTTLIDYIEQSPVNVTIEKPAAISFDIWDRLYIAGSDQIGRIDSSGFLETIIRTDEPVHCLYID